jgi:cytochrome oxidase Cu insertion factor (SCO1/SenC/PrrC family)
MKRFTIVGVLLLALLLAACGSPAPVEQGIVGQDAPGFTLDDALGGQTSLADFSGQPVLLYFHMAVG